MIDAVRWLLGVALIACGRIDFDRVGVPDGDGASGVPALQR
jgi:hypothetical protein